MASDESSDSSTSLDVEDDLQQSEDDCPLHDRIDNHRLAGLEDRKHVYMWTWSRAPDEASRESVANKIVAAYRAANLRLEHFSVFRERHPSSKSLLERQWHFHVVTQSAERARWRNIAARLREGEHGVSMHCSSVGVGRASYWGAFAYCYVPSAKKPRGHLDSEFFLSAGHPDIPPRLLRDRQPKRARPLDIGKCIKAQNLKTVDQFYSFSKKQAAEGDGRWLAVCYGSPTRKLREQIDSVWAVESAEQRLEDQGYGTLSLASFFQCGFVGLSRSGVWIKALHVWPRARTVNSRISKFCRGPCLQSASATAGPFHHSSSLACRGRGAICTLPILSWSIHQEPFILRIEAIRKIKGMLICRSELLNKATTKKAKPSHCRTSLKGLMLQFGMYISQDTKKMYQQTILTDILQSK